MVANEMFLDSASLRSSIVSHAKTLGYEVTPRNPATVNVVLTTDSEKQGNLMLELYLQLQ